MIYSIKQLSFLYSNGLSSLLFITPLCLTLTFEHNKKEVSHNTAFGVCPVVFSGEKRFSDQKE